MPKQITKYFPLFLLSIFLFPQVEKNIHDLKHKDDFFCKASDKHLHEQQHECPICEFILPVTTVAVNKNFVFSISSFSDFVLPFIEEKAISSLHYSVSLRGPPVVSWFSFFN